MKAIVLGSCFLAVMAALAVWYVETKIRQVNTLVQNTVTDVKATVNDTVSDVRETINVPIEAVTSFVGEIDDFANDVAGTTLKAVAGDVIDESFENIGDAVAHAYADAFVADIGDGKEVRPRTLEELQQRPPGEIQHDLEALMSNLLLLDNLNE